MPCRSSHRWLVDKIDGHWYALSPGRPWRLWQHFPTHAEAVAYAHAQATTELTYRIDHPDEVTC